MENFENNIDHGISETKRQVELLASTEGWVRLSEKQRQYIEASLYTSSRAMRDLSAPGHRRYVPNFRGSKEIGILKQRETPANSSDSRYAESQNRISEWNCHHSIFVLENDGAETLPAPKVDSEFSRSEYLPHKEQSELESRISALGFPCIVQVSEMTDNDKFDEDEMVHSFLVLGRNPSGFICWEKMDIGLPYKVRNLRNIFEDNNDNYSFWGVRKLREFK